MNISLKTSRGYTSIEILIFLLIVTGLIAWSIKPIQNQMRGMEAARTQAAIAEINFRKEKYLFESRPQQIDEFNQAGDETRWQILSNEIQRGGSNIKDPRAFIRFSGRSYIFIGRDSEPVRIDP